MIFLDTSFILTLLNSKKKQHEVAKQLAFLFKEEIGN